MITIILVGYAIVLLFFFYRKRKQQQDVFRRMGIPGPAPHWLWGNLRAIQSDDMYRLLGKWSKEFGQHFGYYEGPIPVLATTNLDFIKQVMVKNFNIFHGRKLWPLQPHPDSEKQTHIVVTRGRKWKRLRTIVNPIFSISKLKMILPIMNKKADVLTTAICNAAKTEESINIHSMYQSLTLDVIGESAFGVDVDSLNNQSEPFLVNCRRLFDKMASKTVFHTLASLFPEIKNILFSLLMKMMPKSQNPSGWLVKNLTQIIHRRKESKVKRQDLLQLMIDAEVQENEIDDLAESALTMTEDEDSRSPNDYKVNSDKRGLVSPTGGTTRTLSFPEIMASKIRTALKASCFTEIPLRRNQSSNKPLNHGRKKYQSVQKKVTSEETIGQSFLFLTAGYETTSNCLAYTSYLLALNQDKQNILLEEIDTYAPQGVEPTYDMLKSMVYLDMVISESLRLYPIVALVTNRQCMEDCVINGINIPKGMNVQANVWTIHHDEHLWPEPFKFEPTRFTAEHKATRHPMAWMPFGAGPRNCVGIRFALLEIKITLVKILQKCRFESSAMTEVPLRLKEVQVLAPADGVHLKLVPRC